MKLLLLLSFGIPSECQLVKKNWTELHERIQTKARGRVGQSLIFVGINEMQSRSNKFIRLALMLFCQVKENKQMSGRFYRACRAYSDCCCPGVTMVLWYDDHDIGIVYCLVIVVVLYCHENVDNHGIVIALLWNCHYCHGIVTVSILSWYGYWFVPVSILSCIVTASSLYQYCHGIVTELSLYQYCHVLLRYCCTLVWIFVIILY